MYTPIYNRQEDEILFLHTELSRETEEEAMFLGEHSAGLECILGMQFAGKVENLDTHDAKYMKGSIGPFSIAIIKGPSLDKVLENLYKDGEDAKRTG